MAKKRFGCLLEGRHPLEWEPEALPERVEFPVVAPLQKAREDVLKLSGRVLETRERAAPRPGE